MFSYLSVLDDSIFMMFPPLTYKHINAYMNKNNLIDLPTEIKYINNPNCLFMHKSHQNFFLLLCFVRIHKKLFCAHIFTLT